MTVPTPLLIADIAATVALGGRKVNAPGTGVSTAVCRCGSPIADARQHRWWHHNRERLMAEAEARLGPWVPWHDIVSWIQTQLTGRNGNGRAADDWDGDTSTPEGMDEWFRRNGMMRS